MTTGRGEEQTCSMRQVTESKLQTLTTAIMEIYGESSQSWSLETLTSIFW